MGWGLLQLEGVGKSTPASLEAEGRAGMPRRVRHMSVSEGQTCCGGDQGHCQPGDCGTAHLLMFMGATLSQAPALGLYLSTELRQLVPSLPPAT